MCLLCLGVLAGLLVGGLARRILGRCGFCRLPGYRVVLPRNMDRDEAGSDCNRNDRKNADEDKELPFFGFHAHARVRFCVPLYAR